MTHGLTFNEKTHVYKLDGAWVPGVTTVLGVLDKPGIPRWAATSVAEFVADNWPQVEELHADRDQLVATLKQAPWDRLDKAGKRGTTFHDFAERILNGEEVDVPEEQVPLVENALRFMDDYDIQPTLVEVCVGSREHKYAGKADLITDGTIWDWKSGKRIYSTTPFQLAAYAGAEFYGLEGDEHPMPPIERAFGVHIREDGYDVLPLQFGPDVFDEFLVIRRAFEIAKRAEGNYKIPGSGYVGTPETKDVA